MDNSKLELTVTVGFEDVKAMGRLLGSALPDNITSFESVTEEHAKEVMEEAMKESGELYAAFVCFAIGALSKVHKEL